MDSSVISFAVTLCLLGSSAASYAFGVLTHGKKAKDLEIKLVELLEDPSYYNDIRNIHLEKIRPRPQSSNGQHTNKIFRR